MFLFFAGKGFSYESRCINYPESPYEAFNCWAQGLRPLQSNSKSEFMTCFLVASRKSNPEAEIHECLSTACSSDYCKYCVGNCSSIKDPVHNSECLNGCYRHKRVNPYIDFPDLWNQDCEEFFEFFNEYYEEMEVNDLASIRIAIEKMCASNIDALPVCYAISKNTWATTLKMLQTETSKSGFCLNMTKAALK